MSESRRKVFNPYMPSYEFVPDGEPHVFGERVYVYGSHDRFDGEMFCLNDYICYSASIYDLADWKYEGVIYRKDQDPRNQNQKEPDEIPMIYHTVGRFPGGLNKKGMHALWAPDVAQGPDGRFYMYYCMDFLPEIGVAVCDTPAGKYEFLGLVRHADGSILGRKDGDLVQFDPGIFIDDDNAIYLFSGNAPMYQKDIGKKQGSQVMILRQDMLTLASEPVRLLPSIAESKGTGFEGHEFFEASSIRKISRKYYLIYSSILSHELCYAISEYPDRDYQFGGTIISIGDVGLNNRTTKEAVNCLGNTHGGIECINGNWYVFYHRQTNRTQYSRQACAEKIYLDDSGRIFQVEVTSCGLNAGPLEALGTYPAYICCHLTSKNGTVFSDQDTMKWDYPFLTQDEPDYGMGDPDSGLEVWDMKQYMQEQNRTGQYIANIQDGAKVGYKYFNINDDVEVKIRIRGRADGTINIYTGENSQSCGSIPVHIFSNQWLYLGGKTILPKGIYSIYFEFKGSGWIDMLEFQFEGK